MLFLETTESVISFVYNIFSCLLVQKGADYMVVFLQKLQFLMDFKDFENYDLSDEWNELRIHQVCHSGYRVCIFWKLNQLLISE